MRAVIFETARSRFDVETQTLPTREAGRLVDTSLVATVEDPTRPHRDSPKRLNFQRYAADNWRRTVANND